MNAAAVSYILCPRPVVKRWRRGVWSTIRMRSLSHTQTQLSKKTLASRVASIKPSMNQGRRHIIHPQWDGRLYGTELLNSVLIGAHEGKCKVSGKKGSFQCRDNALAPNEDFYCCYFEIHSIIVFLFLLRIAQSCRMTLYDTPGIISCISHCELGRSCMHARTALPPCGRCCVSQVTTGQRFTFGISVWNK